MKSFNLLVGTRCMKFSYACVIISKIFGSLMPVFAEIEMMGAYERLGILRPI